jgi:hypothetical protein
LDKAQDLEAKANWLDETIIEIIISEAQNEVADFKKWGFDIIPHRALMKKGFETGDGRGVEVETAFKNPQHRFRVAIVCAMWLTGFDVECLSTLYVDKPMKAHTLMQATARANRRFPGKDFGLIVDYNGMLASLRAALAQYALADEEWRVRPLDGRGVDMAVLDAKAIDARKGVAALPPPACQGEIWRRPGGRYPVRKRHGGPLSKLLWRADGNAGKLRRLNLAVELSLNLGDGRGQAAAA